MVRLQILGTGCARCQTLTERTVAAANEVGLDYRLEKVTDLDQIFAFGVMATPALAIDGNVEVAGQVPTVTRLRELLASKR
jgi:small redox-active disulfide protein 2